MLVQLQQDRWPFRSGNCLDYVVNTTCANVPNFMVAGLTLSKREEHYFIRLPRQVSDRKISR